MTLASPLSITIRLTRPTAGALLRLRSWPVDSQQRARRNAMVAATDCAQRRAERQDVADFLHARELVVEQTPARPADVAHG